MSGVATYTGPFGKEQAERLLWRAGFGPRQGEAVKLSKLGLQAAVQSLTRPSRRSRSSARARSTRRAARSLR